MKPNSRFKNWFPSSQQSTGMWSFCWVHRSSTFFNGGLICAETDHTKLWTLWRDFTETFSIEITVTCIEDGTPTKIRTYIYIYIRDILPYNIFQCVEDISQLDNLDTSLAPLLQIKRASNIRNISMWDAFRLYKHVFHIVPCSKLEIDRFNTESLLEKGNNTLLGKEYVVKKQYRGSVHKYKSLE